MVVVVVAVVVVVGGGGGGGGGGCVLFLLSLLALSLRCFAVAVVLCKRFGCAVQTWGVSAHFFCVGREEVGAILGESRPMQTTPPSRKKPKFGWLIGWLVGWLVG